MMMTTNSPTPSMAAETETLRQAYEALNRGDVPGFAAMFHPEIERVEPADFPMSGTYRGIEAVTAHVVKGRGTWAEGRCDPERFVVVGERIVVLIHVHVRLKNESEWRTGRIADVFAFRNGKATLFRTFGDERQAFEWIEQQNAARNDAS